MIAQRPGALPDGARIPRSGGCRRDRRAAVLLASSLLLAALPFAARTAQAPSSDAAAWQALRDGAILLLRHAQTASGNGDPPGFKLDDCSTQRNLSADGQAQALAIGKAFTAHNVRVGALWSSAWCRAKETAELAFPGRLQLEPAFNSFFSDAALEPVQTRTARDLLLAWRGPGALVVVTHQINIEALTGISPRAGEGVVVRPSGERLAVVGRLNPTAPDTGRRRAV